MPTVAHRLRSCAIAATAVVGAAVAAPAAHADLLGLPGTGCPDEQLSQPFTAWGDGASYALAPGGSFEPGTPAWSTTTAAQVVADNEPWGPGQNALALPAGASATSPATCVSLTAPTLRFFARTTSDSPDSSLRVDVLFRAPLLGVTSLTVGTVQPSSDWQPSQSYLMVVNALALLGSNYQAVALRFVPQGGAAWEIDDVYVDPWSKG